jgi:hypothetical protein
MKRNDFGRPGIPLFFKVWFGFVAALAICIIAVYTFTAVKIVGAVQGSTPEAIGAAIGKAVAGYQKEVR